MVLAFPGNDRKAICRGIGGLAEASEDLEPYGGL